MDFILWSRGHGHGLSQDCKSSFWLLKQVTELGNLNSSQVAKGKSSVVVQYFLTVSLYFKRVPQWATKCAKTRAHDMFSR